MRIPRSLIPTLRLASGEPGRFATHGAHVVVRGGLTRIEVTDARRAAIVEFPTPDDPDADVILNAASLRYLLGDDVAIMAEPEDEFGNVIECDPVRRLRGEDVVIGPRTPDGRISVATETKADEIVAEGTFPPIGSVIPKAAPLGTMRVNAKMLREVLEAAERFSPADMPTVWLSLQPDSTVIVQSDAAGPDWPTFCAILKGVAVLDAVRPALPVYAADDATKAV